MTTSNETGVQAVPPAQPPDELHSQQAHWLAESLHYPDCWDTAAYPTIESALSEVYAYFKCTQCAEPVKSAQAAPAALPCPALYADELVDHEGKPNGIFLGCTSLDVTTRAYIPGETTGFITRYYSEEQMIAALAAEPVRPQEPADLKHLRALVQAESIVKVDGWTWDADREEWIAPSGALAVKPQEKQGEPESLKRALMNNEPLTIDQRSALYSIVESAAAATQAEPVPGMVLVPLMPPPEWFQKVVTLAGVWPNENAPDALWRAVQKYHTAMIAMQAVKPSPAQGEQ